ncbi:secreted protein [Candidatus Magnetobacterium bavaricum]|uniref:Secreted protein n=1 Tax=Candidatus Magnetobacterium bavaricum TaxID=29290 RepID=A0A0F3GXQ8_9BACT|nr:secreted protein [Candidatus Magnetobacterium bavaricum]
MMSKRECPGWCKSGMVLVLMVVAFMSLAGRAVADENYVYKQMWPRLEQSW